VCGIPVIIYSDFSELVQGMVHGISDNVVFLYRIYEVMVLVPVKYGSQS
jgi:hypothetical protein